MTDVHVVKAGSAEFGFVNTPPRLFKLLSHEDHANDLVRFGRTRIGTMSDFRASDGWDELRGDAGEGEFTITLESEEPETITPESASWYLRPVVERLGFPILSRGGTIRVTPRHPDAYMYCTTEVAASSAVSGYGPYVVEIVDVIGFFTALTQHLTDKVGLTARSPHGYLAPCLYLDRSVEVRSQATEVDEMPLAFIKPPSKRSEREVRAIWHPSSPNPAPKIVDCPPLADCCRIV